MKRQTRPFIVEVKNKRGVRKSAHSIWGDIDLSAIAADLNEPLPFDDGAFDVVTCLEGIEHVLSPFRLIGELARVTRPGGRIVLSTPNILNLYSRMQFLFTGTFFLFNPARNIRAAPGEMIDRGHISPVGYSQIRYLADYFGVDVVDVRTDRYKRKALMGLYPLVALPGRLWGRRMFFGDETNGDAEGNRRLYRDLFSPSVIFGRTLIVVMRKRVPE
jgi:SAM-dependent methyltransferase